MKSMYDTSTCSNCNQKIAKGVEIEKNKDEKWVHSVCPSNKKAEPPKGYVDDGEGHWVRMEEKPPRTQEVIHPDDEPVLPNPYKECREACIAAAEFFKSIDYPKDLWGLTQIWNTERIKKK